MGIKVKGKKVAGAGAPGKDGKDPYDSAKEYGYAGTETAFNAALAAVPDHVDDSDIHVTAEEKAAWNDSDVFIATYGTTTSAEIEAAYQAGKAVYCCKNGGQFTPLFMRASATMHLFTNASVINACQSNTWTSRDATYNPATHASTHASGGSDHITPESIGAEVAGAAAEAQAYVQGNLDQHALSSSHITAEERTAWNGKEAGGAAAAVQANLNSHAGNSGIHVTSAEKSAWNGKPSKEYVDEAIQMAIGNAIGGSY